jgi:hypothetical protein
MSETDEAKPTHESWEDEATEKLIFLNAILIAVLTVLAALVAWRASVAGDATGDYDYDGLRAVVASEEVRTLATVEALVHAQAFANYRRYDETVAALDEELKEGGGKDVDLQRKRREADVLVDAKLRMFPNKFLERAGGYDTAREIGQTVANKKRTRDLAPDAHFQSAEAYRLKTERLLWGVVMMTLGLVAFTLVEALQGTARKLAFGGGLLLGLAGTLYSIAMEIAKYE